MRLQLENLIVKYHGEPIGVLNWDKNRDIIEFVYDEDFIQSGVQLSPVLMPLANKIYQYSDLNKDVFKGLPPMVSDSLPDSFGNILMLNYLEKNRIAPSEINSLFRLSYIGQRGVGALEFEPARELGDGRHTINLEEIQKLVKEIFDKKQRKSISYTLDTEEALDYLMNFGASVGGARPKIFIALDQNKSEMQAGDAPPQVGMEYYLIKINNKTGNSNNNQFGKIEFAYYQMAKEVGIQMCDSFLWNNEHFCTRRFDRDNQGNKYHYQTFNSMFGATFTDLFSFSYEQFFEEMKSLKVPQQDLEQFYKQMCFNVILMNRDDHTKNFSMLFKDNQWRYAPAYDLCFSYAPDNIWVRENALSINGKRRDIERADLIAVGDNYFIKNPKQIIDHTLEVASRFQEYTKALDIPKKMTAPMNDLIQKQAVFKNDMEKRR
ncbi:MAG: type II toxin-antitoxin system HipA family toxin [Chitinophagales bacterium]